MTNEELLQQLKFIQKRKFVISLQSNLCLMPLKDMYSR